MPSISKTTVFDTVILAPFRPSLFTKLELPSRGVSGTSRALIFRTSSVRFSEVRKRGGATRSRKKFQKRRMPSSNSSGIHRLM